MGGRASECSLGSMVMVVVEEMDGAATSQPLYPSIHPFTHPNHHNTHAPTPINSPIPTTTHMCHPTNRPSPPPPRPAS